MGLFLSRQLHCAHSAFRIPHSAFRTVAGAAFPWVERRSPTRRVRVIFHQPAGLETGAPFASDSSAIPPSLCRNDAVRPGSQILANQSDPFRPVGSVSVHRSDAVGTENGLPTRLEATFRPENAFRHAKPLLSDLPTPIRLVQPHLSVPKGPLSPPETALRNRFCPLKNAQLTN